MSFQETLNELQALCTPLKTEREGVEQLKAQWDASKVELAAAKKKNQASPTYELTNKISGLQSVCEELEQRYNYLKDAFDQKLKIQRLTADTYVNNLIFEEFYNDPENRKQAEKVLKKLQSLLNEVEVYRAMATASKEKTLGRIEQTDFIGAFGFINSFSDDNILLAVGFEREEEKNLKRQVEQWIEKIPRYFSTD